MIQSVDRSLIILEYLKQHPKGLGVTEIANLLGVAKSTAHRLIMTLEEHGYVKQMEETSVYRLGLKFLEMSNIVVDQLNVVELAHPIMEKISKQTDKISHLVMLDDFQVIYIDKVETPSAVRIYSQLGRRAPIYCTGVGKAIAAYFDEAQLKRYLSENSFHKFTKNTYTEEKEFKQELERIRSNGYSVDNEEHEEGIRCVAVPIFDHLNRVNYSVSITGTSVQMTDQRIQEYLPLLKESAKEISSLLGSAQ
ncbi:IclR family transcriptional regulator [Thalassobacillus devorans]|uniref:IclR family transcriptional regulator n=1 Tax=Thalassobacillus devorans TaxID=279813 RepID=A0ABQ1NTV4_9BACI|nr:IclR family transcriptional regulator [Thalassobacillus devorans]NIK28644.1 DNA-binding IclR family transcriptional regulator [Thalassobacillus devorans]GGC84625.1 IclR family transcriptional regulator [Thalassobacillus devorans]